MIHILRDGQQFGPYTIEDINTFLSEGSLLTSDQAWHEGSEGWIPITEVPGGTFTEGTSLGMPTDQNTIAQSALNSSKFEPSTIRAMTSCTSYGFLWLFSMIPNNSSILYMGSSNLYDLFSA